MGSAAQKGSHPRFPAGGDGAGAPPAAPTATGDPEERDEAVVERDVEEPPVSEHPVPEGQPGGARVEPEVHLGGGQRPPGPSDAEFRGPSAHEAQPAAAEPEDEPEADPPHAD